MGQHGSLVEFKDVAGVLIQFSTAQVNSLVLALSSEQRRYAKVLANTIKEPQEIWQHWVAHDTEAGAWQQVRTYLHYFDLSATDVSAPFGVSIVQFAFRSKWELLALDLKTGEMGEVMSEINKTFRVGSIEYSSAQQ
ncbi:MAG: hypothetical protein JSS58_01840 [Proteobacteria bacterium]|nr:hypothetical protein [Pseudomonadota bacterium]